MVLETRSPEWRCSWWAPPGAVARAWAGSPAPGGSVPHLCVVYPASVALSKLVPSHEDASHGLELRPHLTTSAKTLSPSCMCTALGGPELGDTAQLSVPSLFQTVLGLEFRVFGDLAGTQGGGEVGQGGGSREAGVREGWQHLAWQRVSRGPSGWGGWCWAVHAADPG